MVSAFSLLHKEPHPRPSHPALQTNDGNGGGLTFSHYTTHCHVRRTHRILAKTWLKWQSQGERAGISLELYQYNIYLGAQVQHGLPSSRLRQSRISREK